jgi:hypothetical protein
MSLSGSDNILHISLSTHTTLDDVRNLGVCLGALDARWCHQTLYSFCLLRYVDDKAAFEARDRCQTSFPFGIFGKTTGVRTDLTMLPALSEPAVRQYSPRGSCFTLSESSASLSVLGHEYQTIVTNGPTLSAGGQKYTFPNVTPEIVSNGT